jgi:hypothetical protein
VQHLRIEREHCVVRDQGVRVDLSNLLLRGTDIRGIRFLGVNYRQHRALSVLEETGRNVRVSFEESRSTLSEPGILIFWQVAPRVMDGQFVAVLEVLRVDHQIAAPSVLRRGEQNTFRTAFDRHVGK